jgi:predicted secreted hydrolase
VRRRTLLRALAGAPLLAATPAARAQATQAAADAAPQAAAAVTYPAVVRRPLAFPRDHGSHPAFRTEWWYVTGWTEDATGTRRGVQVTFFRSRPGVAEREHSAFAPLQLLFAHAAVADPEYGRLRHDQRATRAGFGLAQASEATTDVKLDEWSLVLAGGTYRARIPARDFALDLAFAAHAPPLLNGDAGVSRKGPQPSQASYYYSRPQLRVDGTLTIDGRAHVVHGSAWLDHEWSSEYLAPGATGWDWTGLNLDDGGALIAFRIRDAQGGTLWAGGTLQRADGTVQHLTPGAVTFETVRQWRSPRTGTQYPVAQRVTAGPLVVDLVPLLDDQELDARGSVGIVYWEGAVVAQGAGRALGRGYLELTGYAGTLRI